MFYSVPTRVGEVYRFDLCRDVISSPVPSRTFALVAYLVDGSLCCNCLRILSIETRLLDQYTIPADDEEIVPKIAGTGSQLEDLGWIFTGQTNMHDYLILYPDERPILLFETIGTWDEYLLDIRTMSALDDEEPVSAANLRIRLMIKARDHWGLNGEPKR